MGGGQILLPWDFPLTQNWPWPKVQVFGTFITIFIISFTNSVKIWVASKLTMNDLYRQMVIQGSNVNNK